MNWHELLNEAIETTGEYQKVAPDVFKGFSLMGQAAKKMERLVKKLRSL